MQQEHRTSTVNSSRLCRVETNITLDAVVLLEMIFRNMHARRAVLRDRGSLCKKLHFADEYL